jgi:hypothetical protein
MFGCFVGHACVEALLTNEIRQGAHKVRCYLLYEEQWIGATTGTRDTQRWVALVYGPGQRIY